MPTEPLPNQPRPADGVGGDGRAGEGDSTIATEWEMYSEWWREGFTDGADAEYVEQIIPLILEWLPEEGSVLDVGAGEGQIARAAAFGGRFAVALERSEAQLVAGVERGGAVHWVRGEAVELPVPDGVFDAVVLCLVIEHIADFEAALGEAARVLRPGGRLLIVMNHPLLQTPGSGWIDDHILDEQYWRIGPYLTETSTVEEVSRDVFLTFHHRPLGRYLNAAAEVGLALTRLVEPVPPEEFLEDYRHYTHADAIPRLAFMVHTRL